MEKDIEKIAILIDAENINSKNAKKIVDIMEERGNILAKVIIANLMSSSVSGWIAESKKYAMRAVHQPSLVKGKNSSDMALTIQAMKMLYEKPFLTTFCIVSNDSDFTRLAQELKEQDKIVIGMGNKTIVKEAVNAYSEFIYLDQELEELETEAPKATKKTTKKQPAKKKAPQVIECPLEEDKLSAFKRLVADLIESNENGYAYYSAIADNMKKQFADFVPQNYNCKNSSQLIDKVIPFLDGYVKEKLPMQNNPNGFILYLRKK